MLTPDQIAAYKTAAEEITRPMTEYLLQDIARRVSEAGQLTSTAAYEVWRAQQLGMSQKEIKKGLRRILKTSRKQVNKLLTQSAEEGYNFEISRLGGWATTFAKNASLQQFLDAAIKTVGAELDNITQTIGMVAPDGKPYPLQQVYRKATDYAFEQVSTGVVDYNTAIRQACKNLAQHGLRVIDYESGVHTSIEGSVRRNIMGGLGLLQEQISQDNHDKFGADGWEISAHAASAPDHEPYQGKQYTDEQYEALNGRLARRIGTLNCGHAAFPIILGINEPQYTEEQLAEFRRSNADGLTYQGRHYTMYEATQKQNQIERAIQKQKRRVLVDEATADSDKLLTDQIKLRRLNDEYHRYCGATGLPTRSERLQVAGFGRSQAQKAVWANKRVVKGARNGILKDINLEPLQITTDSLKNVRAFECQCLDSAGQRALKNAHKRLLTSIAGKPLGTEASATYSLDMRKLGGFVGEDAAGRVKIPDADVPYIGLHTHPTGGTFTHTDIELFARRKNMMMLTAVGNNGAVYAVEKSNAFNEIQFKRYREEMMSKYPYRMNSPEQYVEYMDAFLKGAEACGIRYYAAGT